jgi:hypothetical protein
MEEPQLLEESLTQEHRYSFNHLNWARIEVYFLRILACLFLLRGIYDWGVIIGFYEGRGGYFEALPLNIQLLYGFTAVFSLISGVGLWTLNAWGNAVWLFLSIAILVIDLAGFISPNPVLQSLTRPFMRIFFDFLLVFIYFIISIQAHLASERVIRS